ncbi:MAG: HlyD family efflux transporter periplasmic adaptor subunit [Deltaproteobacteria bacterium]|nr:MAG: HlyD family efflux transporter periplasmic adaptor subunit [Deltaproteobacteria bacterium]
MLLLAALLALSGCSGKQPAGFQGYAEGDFVHVASSLAGRLDRLLVTRGQQVPAGAPLFALESENEAAAYRQARQQLSAAEAQLEDLRTGKRPQELDVIRAQLAQAVAEEKRSAADRVRDEALFKADVIPRARIDETRARAASDAARVRELKSQLDVASLSARDEQIKAQAANVAAARAVLEQAEWKLHQKAVAAPGAALVFDVLYREGEWVQAGGPVVRLLPPENIKVRFFVQETVVGALSVGKDVVLRCDGCPAEIPAKVTFISTASEYTPPIIYSNETRSKLVFMIEARPPASMATGLHPGQPVEVRMR